MIEFEEYIEWMLEKRKSPRTIQNYCYELKKFPNDFNEHRSFIKDNKDKKMLIFAYRSYLRFLKRKGTLNREQLLDLLDVINPPKRRGKSNNELSGQSFHRDEWREIVKKGPNKMAKFGIWIGFNFGLRLSEIIYLRVQDVDLDKMIIRITSKGREKDKIEVTKGHFIYEKWTPKHDRERTVSINTKYQVGIFSRWLKDRPKSIKHDYLLWSPKSLEQLKDRTFQRWCKQACSDLRPHDLRRSFATTLFYATNKDIKIVQELLGHSNIATTSQYLRLDEETILKKAREAMS